MSQPMRAKNGTREVQIPAGEITLNGELIIPRNAAAEFAHLRAGYFSASTGAAAALVAAAQLGEIVGAVVSRGGRPDLTADSLPLVKAPTLLIVGGLDYPVIRRMAA